ncbi:hypothetical protein [Lysobacter sp. CA199]|uniref:hypothetical protein n=1 Tax=Lysobacter sp. CA199 TaxID=3455608 RepID=UPI003F8D2B38
MDRNGGVLPFQISKIGRSTYIQKIGGKRHFCHPSVDGSVESVRKEIAPAFRIRVSEVALKRSAGGRYAPVVFTSGPTEWIFVESDRARQARI